MSPSSVGRCPPSLRAHVEQGLRQSYASREELTVDWPFSHLTPNKVISAVAVQRPPSISMHQVGPCPLHGRNELQNLKRKVLQKLPSCF